MTGVYEQMEMIGNFRLKEPLRNDKSGYAKWGFAYDMMGREVFIKEFLSPVYPLDATVLSAEQIRKKRDVCDKFEFSKKMFYNELNRCSTGNVVTITDFFRHGSKYYMVTDKVDAAAIEPEEISRFTVEQKVLIIKVILHCMHSLHQHDIVHGDIKPNNILFKRTNSGMYTAKIIDFDSSFLESNPPKNDEELQGDMVYLAPESFLFIAEEGGVLSKKIDIFALGILFHQYFCGELPRFDRVKYDYTFEAVLDGCQPDIHPSIPTNIREMIKKMLDKDPDKRPDVEELFFTLTGNSINPVSKPKDKPEAVHTVGYISGSDPRTMKGADPNPSTIDGELKSTIGKGSEFMSRPRVVCDKLPELESGKSIFKTVPPIEDGTYAVEERRHTSSAMDDFFKKADDLL